MLIYTIIMGILSFVELVLIIIYAVNRKNVIDELREVLQGADLPKEMYEQIEKDSNIYIYVSVVVLLIEFICCILGLLLYLRYKNTRIIRTVVRTRSQSHA